MPKREKHELGEIKDIGNRNEVCNREHHISSKSGNKYSRLCFFTNFFIYLIYTNDHGMRGV